MTEPTPLAWAFSRCGCVVSTHRTREAADAVHTRLLQSRRYRYGGGGPIQVNIYPLTTKDEVLNAKREARRTRGTDRRTT